MAFFFFLHLVSLPAALYFLLGEKCSRKINFLLDRPEFKWIFQRLFQGVWRGCLGTKNLWNEEPREKLMMKWGKSNQYQAESVWLRMLMLSRFKIVKRRMFALPNTSSLRPTKVPPLSPCSTIFPLISFHPFSALGFPACSLVYGVMSEGWVTPLLPICSCPLCFSYTWQQRMKQSAFFYFFYLTEWDWLILSSNMWRHSSCCTHQPWSWV